MNQPLSRRSALKTVGAGVLLAGGVSTGALAAPTRGALARDLAAVRSATARYNDPANADADGYAHYVEGVPLPLEDVVEDGEALCDMGYHFVNFEYVLDMFEGIVDRTRPVILVYGADDEGNLVLGGVEYVVPDALLTDAYEWFAGTGDDDAWEPFTGAPAPFPTSALHAWVHTHNPLGVFSHANPRKLFSPAGCLGDDHDHEE